MKGESRQHSVLEQQKNLQTLLRSSSKRNLNKNKIPSNKNNLPAFRGAPRSFEQNHTSLKNDIFSSPVPHRMLNRSSSVDSGINLPSVNPSFSVSFDDKPRLAVQKITGLQSQSDLRICNPNLTSREKKPHQASSYNKKPIIATPIPVSKDKVPPSDQKHDEDAVTLTKLVPNDRKEIRGKNVISEVQTQLKFNQESEGILSVAAKKNEVTAEELSDSREKDTKENLSPIWDSNPSPVAFVKDLLLENPSTHFLMPPNFHNAEILSVTSSPKSAKSVSFEELASIHHYQPSIEGAKQKRRFKSRKRPKKSSESEQSDEDVVSEKKVKLRRENLVPVGILKNKGTDSTPSKIAIQIQDSSDDRKNSSDVDKSNFIAGNREGSNVNNGDEVNPDTQKNKSIGDTDLKITSDTSSTAQHSAAKAKDETLHNLSDKNLIGNHNPYSKHNLEKGEHDSDSKLGSREYPSFESSNDINVDSSPVKNEVPINVQIRSQGKKNLNAKDINSNENNFQEGLPKKSSILNRNPGGPLDSEEGEIVTNGSSPIILDESPSLRSTKNKEDLPSQNSRNNKINQQNRKQSYEQSFSENALKPDGDIEVPINLNSGSGQAVPRGLNLSTCSEIEGKSNLARHRGVIGRFNQDYNHDVLLNSNSVDKNNYYQNKYSKHSKLEPKKSLLRSNSFETVNGQNIYTGSRSRAFSFPEQAAMAEKHSTAGTQTFDEDGVGTQNSNVRTNRINYAPVRNDNRNLNYELHSYPAYHGTGARVYQQDYDAPIHPQGDAIQRQDQRQKVFRLVAVKSATLRDLYSNDGRKVSMIATPIPGGGRTSSIGTHRNNGDRYDLTESDYQNANYQRGTSGVSLFRRRSNSVSDSHALDRSLNMNTNFQKHAHHYQSLGNINELNHYYHNRNYNPHGNYGNPPTDRIYQVSSNNMVHPVPYAHAYRISSSSNNINNADAINGNFNIMRSSISDTDISSRSLARVAGMENNGSSRTVARTKLLPVLEHPQNKKKQKGFFNFNFKFPSWRSKKEADKEKESLVDWYHQLGRLVSESACERKDPGSKPAADMVDAARNTAWDLGASSLSDVLTWLVPLPSGGWYAPTVVEWSAARVLYRVSACAERLRAGSKPGNEYELFLVSRRELALIGEGWYACCTSCNQLSKTQNNASFSGINAKQFHVMEAAKVAEFVQLSGANPALAKQLLHNQQYDYDRALTAYESLQNMNQLRTGQSSRRGVAHVPQGPPTPLALPSRPLPQLRQGPSPNNLPLLKPQYNALNYSSADATKLNNKPSISVKSYAGQPVSQLSPNVYREDTYRNDAQDLVISHGKSDSVDSSDGLRRTRDGNTHDDRRHEYYISSNAPSSSANILNSNQLYLESERNTRRGNVSMQRIQDDPIDMLPPPPPPPRAYRLIRDNGSSVLIPASSAQASALVLERMRLQALENSNRGPPPVPPHGAMPDGGEHYTRSHGPETTPQVPPRRSGRSSTPGSRYGSSTSINYPADCSGELVDYRAKLSSVRATLGDEASSPLHLGERRPGSVSHLNKWPRNNLERTGSVMSMREGNSSLNRSASSAAKNALLREKVLGGRKLSSSTTRHVPSSASPSPVMSRNLRGKSEEISGRSLAERSASLYEDETRAGVYSKPNVPKLKDRSSSFEDEKGIRPEYNSTNQVSPSKVSLLVGNYNAAVESQHQHLHRQSQKLRKGSSRSRTSSPNVTGKSQKSLENLAEQEARELFSSSSRRRSRHGVTTPDLTDFAEIRKPLTPPPSASSLSDPITNLDSYRQPLNLAVPMTPTSVTDTHPPRRSRAAAESVQARPASALNPDTRSDSASVNRPDETVGRLSHRTSELSLNRKSSIAAKMTKLDKESDSTDSAKLENNRNVKTEASDQTIGCEATGGSAENVDSGLGSGSTSSLTPCGPYSAASDEPVDSSASRHDVGAVDQDIKPSESVDVLDMKTHCCLCVELSLHTIEARCWAAAVSSQRWCVRSVTRQPFFAFNYFDVVLETRARISGACALRKRVQCGMTCVLL
ncbi:hypothetical protein FHG87_000064 [Trinorchestia longiramus]|nr:hypothetical protein FHG87_000064 [Trinorchestia longiramus]